MDRMIDTTQHKEVTGRELRKPEIILLPHIHGKHVFIITEN